MKTNIRNNAAIWVESLVRNVLVVCLIFAAGCSAESKLARHLTRGGKYFKKEEYRKAAIEYMNALRLDPANQTATRQLGLAAFETGDARTAFPLLLRAETINSNDTAVCIKLGTLFLAASDRTQARKRADAALRNEPDNLDAIILWTGSIASSNEIDAALARLDAVSAKSGTLPRFALAKGALFVQKRDPDAAEQVYSTTARLNPESWELHMALGDLYLMKRDTARADQEYRTAARLAPPASKAHLRLAQFLRLSGKTKEARETLENVAKQAPLFTPAQYSLAEMAFADKDYETCRNLLERILKANPSDISAFLLLQRTEAAQGKIDKAIEGYERLIAMYPKTAEGHHLLGMALLMKGDQTRATSELEKAVSLNPRSGESVGLLAELYVRAGNADTAISVLRTYLRQQPQALPAHLLLAAAYSAKRNLAQAERIYRDLIAQMPKNPRIHYLLGMNLARQGNESGAVAEFEEALSQDPGFAEAVEQLASIEATRQKNWDGAVARIEAQILKAPRNSALYYLLGATCLRKGDPARAETAIQKAIEIQPDSAAAYSLLAQAYAALNQNEQAFAKLDRSLAVTPNNTTALMLKGALLQSQKKMDAAISQYEKILSVNPRFFPAINNLACLYGEIPAKLDKALEHAKRARALAPKDPAVADTLGWILYLRGDYMWALTLEQESAEQLPRNPEVLYHLGMCQIAVGDEAEGSETLAKALEAARDFPGATEAIAMKELLTVAEDGTTLKTAKDADALLKRYPDVPSALLRAGRAYERLGDYSAAGELYDKAIEANSHFIPALLSLADLCLARLGKPDRAMVLARQAREKAPGDPKVTSAVAWIAFRNGSYSWAQSLLSEIVKGQEASPEDQYHLGLLNYASGKTDAAIALIGQALQSAAGFPSAPEARRFLDLVKRPETGLALVRDAESAASIPIQALPAAIYSAETAARAGQREKASVLCEKIVKQYPDFAPALRQTAILSLGAKTFQDPTYKLLIRAREQLPSDPDVAQALGEASYARKQYDFAARLLQESADKYPDRAAVFYYLGMSHYQLQRREQARKFLTRAMELDPGAEWAEEARKSLK